MDRLVDGRDVEIQSESDKLASEAIPGFKLDLARVRKSFQALTG